MKIKILFNLAIFWIHSLYKATTVKPAMNTLFWVMTTVTLTDFSEVKVKH